MAFLKNVKKVVFDTSLFRLCYLGVYFLYMITRVCTSIDIRAGVALLTLWGVVVGVYNLIRSKSYNRIIYGFWLLLFLISFVITTLTHISADYYAVGFNIFLVFQTIVCFLLFFGMHAENNPYFRFEMYLFFRFYIYITTITSGIGLMLMLLSNSEVLYQGTFTGIYLNPNLQGFVSATAVVFCHMVTRPDFVYGSSQKHISFIWIASCVILNGTALILSDSNASILFLGTYFTFIVFMRLLAMSEELTPFKIIIRFLAIAAVAVLLIYILMFVRVVFRLGVAALTASDGELSRQDISKLTQNSVFSFVSDSGLNSRLSLWDTGIAIFTRFPVFGAGKGDLYRLIVETSGDRSYFTPDYFTNILIADMHSGYLSILVTAGVIGFVLFSIFLWRFVFRVSFPVWFVQRRIMKNSVYPCLLALMCSYLIFSTIERTILFTDSFFIIFFWLILGYISCFAKESGYNKRGVVRLGDKTFPKILF